MHELGLCDAILKSVERAVRDEQLEGVSRVTVEVGMLSGVVPRYLTDCWQAVIDATPFQNTVLEIETINGIARCEDCGAEFLVDLKTLKCPDCGSGKLTPLTGTDLTISEIEAY